MFSGLKKLSNAFIFFSVISIICSMQCLKLLLLSDIANIDDIYLIFIYLLFIIPAIFIYLSIVLNKIIKELIAKDIHISERVRKLEQHQE